MLIAGDIFRPINWRWQRAMQLATSNSRVDKDDDKWVRDARKYIVRSNSQTRGTLAGRRGQKIDTNMADVTLFKAFPLIHQAQSIFKTCGFYRLAIEAYITSRAPNEEVAMLVGISKELIDAYEALFFDVRDRLGDVFAAENLVTRLHTHSMDSGDQDTFMKAVAYFKGSGLLSAILGRRLENKDVINQLNGLTLQQLTANGLITSMIRNPNAYNAHEVMEETPMFQRMLARSQNPDGDETGDDKLDEAAGKLADSLSYSLLSVNSPSIYNMELRQADIIKQLAEGKKSDIKVVQSVTRAVPAPKAPAPVPPPKAPAPIVTNKPPVKPVVRKDKP